MVVILAKDCFDLTMETVSNHEMVIDTKDWFLRNYENIHVLESLHNMEMQFYLTPYGYRLVRDAMVGGDH